MWIVRELLRFAGRIAIWITSSMGWATLQHAPGPKMTATAVFVGSGVVCLALGVAL